MARDFLGSGLKFPVRIQRTGGFVLSSAEQKIQESIWLILATASGERQMLPRFGCGIHNLVFAPNNTATRGSVAQQVRQALTTWEPRIQVLDVHVDSAPDDPAQLLIRVDYQIRQNNVIQNMVYPFFINEGKGA
jgi:phage baseplate assembly protein W